MNVSQEQITVRARAPRVRAPRAVAVARRPPAGAGAHRMRPVRDASRQTRAGDRRICRQGEAGTPDPARRALTARGVLGCCVR